MGIGAQPLPPSSESSGNQTGLNHRRQVLRRVDLMVWSRIGGPFIQISPCAPDGGGTKSMGAANVTDGIADVQGRAMITIQPAPFRSSGERDWVRFAHATSVPPDDRAEVLAYAQSPKKSF